MSATRRSQASALGALFFLVVLLMSLVTIELVASSLRESLEVVKALREDVSNDERLGVVITDYYAAQPSYATSVAMVKGTYVSGTLASLREVDGDYYAVEPPGVGGMPS